MALDIPCKVCREGKMVEKKGKFGNFLGCTTYPKCGRTINLTVKTTDISIKRHAGIGGKNRKEL